MLPGKNQTRLKVPGFFLFNDLDYIGQTEARLVGRVEISGQFGNSVLQGSYGPREVAVLLFKEGNPLLRPGKIGLGLLLIFKMLDLFCFLFC